MKNNIVLIGMPGAGKSTVGVVLAKTLGYNFVDTDILLSTGFGMTLQAYIDTHGLTAFLEAEEKLVTSLKLSETVIATGGSVALSEVAMEHLKSGSTIIYIDVPLQELIRRLQNITTRGIALRPGQSIADIYHDRRPLYEKYADITVPEKFGGNAALEEIVTEIVEKLSADS